MPAVTAGDDPSQYFPYLCDFMGFKEGKAKGFYKAWKGFKG